MFTTALFAFFSGIVTVASPCVLPVLPFLLSGTIGGRARPYGIIAGFVASFTIFTLFLSTLVQLLAIPTDTMRYVSVGLLFVFGLVLVVPALHNFYERLTTRSVANISGVISKNNNSNTGFWSGTWVGATLGLLWTPCVGPIMASVITLALSGAVTLQAGLVTLAFSVGTGLSMLLVMLGGRKLLGRIPGLFDKLPEVQRVFGAVMVVFAIGMWFNADRKLQTWFLDSFPNYAEQLTEFEKNAPTLK